MRRHHGQLGASPELVLASMLECGELPEDESCLVCRAQTGNVRHFLVICERIGVTGAAGIWTALRIICTVGLLDAFVATRNSCEHRGRNVRFRVPVCLCPKCDGGRSMNDFKRLLCRVPIYAHLLAKYPDAEVVPN